MVKHKETKGIKHMPIRTTQTPDGLMAEQWNDDTKTYTDFRVKPPFVRPYTAEESADADSREEAQNALIQDLETRVAALEAIVLSHTTPPTAGNEPTFADLTGAQNGAIYAGQVFKWTDRQRYKALTGPMNSNATPSTYPAGYAVLSATPTAKPWSGASVAYAVGDLVIYSGKTYKCITAHTSQAGWTPDIVPSLWSLV